MQKNSYPWHQRVCIKCPASGDASVIPTRCAALQPIGLFAVPSAGSSAVPAAAASPMCYPGNSERLHMTCHSDTLPHAFRFGLGPCMCDCLCRTNKIKIVTAHTYTMVSPKCRPLNQCKQFRPSTLHVFSPASALKYIGTHWHHARMLWMRHSSLHKECE